MSGHVTIVDNESIPWVNGKDVFATMEPAFRDNLGGNPEQVRSLLSKYWLKQLWVDESTRRIDHVRTEPGYIDLGEAYHGSVEEALFLGGRAELSAEGTFVMGDYFWRPPGWVHMARAPEGFEAILMMEGEERSESSGRVSRVVRGDDEAGQNPLLKGEAQIGPRGYVRRMETRYMVWRRHDDTITLLGDATLHSKSLSLNEETGACTVLVRLPAGWSSTPGTSPRARFCVPVSTGLSVDGQILSPNSLVQVPAGSPAPPLRVDAEVDLFMKVGMAR